MGVLHQPARSASTRWWPGGGTCASPSDPETRIPSFVGVALVAAAAGLLSYGVVGSEEVGWVERPDALALRRRRRRPLLLFVAHQRRTEAPALDLELFRIPNFAWGNLAMLVFGTAFSALFFGSILFLTQVWDWSILEAGFGVAPGPAMVALVAPRAGRLAGRIGQRPILLAGGVLYAGSGLYRLRMLGPEVDYLARLLPVDGAQRARRRASSSRSSPASSPRPCRRTARGVGGAALQAVRQFGGTFGVALTIAFLGRDRAGPRRLRPHLVAHRHRWARHVGAW